MAFQLSPGVNISEIDLRGVVPAVSTSAGAFAGDFQWGPVNKATLVSHESDLVTYFGKPNDVTAIDFLSAANFLAYATTLYVVRAANTGSLNADSTGNVNVQIANSDAYEYSYLSQNNNNVVGPFVARFPGTLGNSLQVDVCSGNTSGEFASWTHKNRFTSAPTTSVYATQAGGANDQLHVVVSDAGGLFTGVKNTVLEVFPFLSKASDAKYDDGTSAYYKQVILNQSKYVYATDPVSYTSTANTWGNVAANTNFAVVSNQSLTLSGGTSATVTDSDMINAYSEFVSADDIDISLVMLGDASVTVQQYVIDNIATTRLDCIAFLSPRKTDVVNQSGNETTNIQNYLNTLSRSTSYAFVDSGWKYQFDKYNNTYRYVPLNPDIAGLCARTDQTNDPWFSPAGYSRGAIKNVVKLAWNPGKAERDVLYPNAVNPVVSFHGQGTILYGDKTLLSQPSVFDRINVRRLFIVLEKAIATAAKFSLFNLNDEFTRAQFIALVEPYLRDVQGRRGIYDYRVVCDTTNNTQQVIDSNQFVGDIYLKPARSINFIQLNFVAVGTGVEFTEIVGTF